MTIRRRLRLRAPRGVEEAPAEDHPRILTTSAGLTSLRAAVKSDPDLQARWQTAATQIEDANSTWHTAPNDAYMLAFIAFLMAVRTSDDDLGITWGETWQTYVDHILDVAINQMAQSGQPDPIAVGQALIYDCLYPVMTTEQRASLAAAVEAGWTGHQFSLGNSVQVWDNGASETFFAKALCGLASESFAERLNDIYLYSMRVVDGNEWMGYGFGLGREFHEGFPSRQGLPLLLHALQNAGGYTDAQTIDRFLVHLRDNWHLCTQAIIPHPSAAAQPANFFLQDKFHTQDPDIIHHRKRNVSANMLWAMALLPGKMGLSASGMSDQATLANSEAAYLGYLHTKFDEVVNGASHNRVTDVTRICTRFGDPSFTANFWAFPAWLIHNAQQATAVSHTDAGIPRVRRFWPGTLDWTFIESSDFSPTSGSVIRYRHRKYGASQYEEGCRQNGCWTLHRNGPLLIQGGETGHGTTTKRATSWANGGVSFFDPDLYPDFTFPNSDDDDSSYQRAVSGDGFYKEQILANAALDFGDVTGWYADASAVAISSDLVRSYNSSVIQTGSIATNAPKVSAFTREFVTIRHGGDGTTREKVFTYDRITLVDVTIQPRYHLVPATQPDIDGTEDAVTPWSPEQADETYNWYATGPTRWNYTGATRLRYQNDAEPDAPTPGTGKVQVTWLEPSGGDVTVQKLSGINCVSKVTASRDGAPTVNPWGAWVGSSDQATGWPDDKQAYVGMASVAISPTDIEAWNTAGGHFLIACEAMAVGDTPSTPTTLIADATSIGAQCGPSAVLFGKDGERASGSVTIPSGVVRLVITNLPPSTAITLTPTTLAIESEGRTSSDSGVLVVELDGTAGSLAFEEGASAQLTHLMGVGAVSATSITYRARANEAATLSIEYSDLSDLSGSSISAGVAVVSDDDFTGGETISGLGAGTTYYYSILVDGARAQSAPFPSFKTLPASGTVTIVAGSDMDTTPSGSAAFASMAAETPDLCVILGDFIVPDDPTLAVQRADYQTVYASGTDFHDNLVRAVPIEHGWSDHDYGGSNEDGDLANKTLSLQAFKEYNVSYTMANPTQGIWRSWTMPNAECFLVDTRYQREGVRQQYGVGLGLVADAGSGGSTLIARSADSPSGTPNFYRTWYISITTASGEHIRRVTAYDGSTHAFALSAAVDDLDSTSVYYLRRASLLDMDMITDGQTEWLIDGIRDSTAVWKVIFSEVIWNPTAPTSDNWSGWTPSDDNIEQRYIIQELAGVDNILVISGDRHVSAIDDGTASVYPEGTFGPLNADSFSVTGNWSQGVWDSGRSYGVLTLSATQATFTARKADGTTATGVTPLTVNAA